LDSDYGSTSASTAANTLTGFVLNGVHDEGDHR
jgi:hypothetical protein